MRTSRFTASFGLSVCVGWALGGCPAETVPDDTDSDPVVDTDTDAGVVPARSGQLRLVLVTEALPTDTRARLRCDGRDLIDEGGFNVIGRREWTFTVTPGELCAVDLFDARGGVLPGGELYNCSVRVGSWGPERGLERTVAEVEVAACVPGCVDPVAENHDPEATLDDGSCTYVFGCTDPDALNHDPAATRDDGRCDYGGFGRVEIVAHTDARPQDTEVRLSCGGRDVVALDGLTAQWATLSAASNVDAGFDCDVVVVDRFGDASATGRVDLCGVTVADWDPQPARGFPYEAVVGSFRTAPCSGCTDPMSVDFDPAAYVDDGSCTY